MMKRTTKIKSSDLPAEPILMDICPAGYMQCNCDKRLPYVEFKKVVVEGGCQLAMGKENTKRILFLITGMLSISTHNKEPQFLNAGECIFLMRDYSTKVMAICDVQLFMLDTSNRPQFCRHDILKTLADYQSTISEHPHILPILPRVSTFLESLLIFDNEINKPCYHIIKEQELVVIMWYTYGAKQLRSFCKDVISARDDFRAFVLNSYDRIDTMQELARLSNMSTSTFRRLFDVTFGETYQSWRMKQKAIKIIDVIKEGTTSHAEIMRQLDFKSYPAFYRFCIKHLHENPTLLKEKYAPNSQSIIKDD